MTAHSRRSARPDRRHLFFLLLTLTLGFLAAATPAATATAGADPVAPTADDAFSTAIGAVPHQSTGDQAEVLDLAIVTQSAVVGPSATFTMTLDASTLGGLAPIDGQTDPLAGLTVSVVLYGMLESEEELLDEPSRFLNRRPDVPLETVLDPTTLQLAVSVPIRSGTSFDEIDRALVPDDGVYPVVVEIRRPDKRLVARGATTMIRLPDGPVEQDPFVADHAVLLSIGGDGGLSVDDAVTLLETHRRLPVVVAIHHDAIDTLTERPRLLPQLADALGGRTVVAVPDLGLDPSALAEVGRQSVYGEVMASSRAALAALGFTPTGSIAVVGDPLTSPGAGALSDLGVTTVLDVSGSGSSGVLTSADGRTVDVLAVDGQSSGDLGAAGSGVVRAQRILARLVFRSGTEAPVLIDSANVSGDPVSALDPLYAAFEVPGSQPVQVDGANPLSGPELIPATSPTRSLTPVLDTLAGAEAALATYQSFYVDGPDEPAGFRAELIEALSVDTSDSQLTARIRGITAEMIDLTEVVALPENQSVTLAAQSAQIPLTIESRAEGSRQVLLRFRGDKIVVAENEGLFTINPGTNPIDVAVTARSLGAFPLTVSVYTPDGRRELATTRFQVRSTAIPGLGIAIIAVGLAVLAVWWFVSVRRRRRPLELQAPVEPGPDSDRSASPVPTSGTIPDDEVASPSLSLDRGEALTSDSVSP